MTDYYKVLGVRKGATLSEIKSTYRKKVKKYHPDTSDSKSLENTLAFHEIVSAYKKILEDFDSTFFKFHSDEQRKKTEKPSFDYRLWLRERGDYESRTKLVFFDLMHNREGDAVEEYKEMKLSHSDFSLKTWVTREDFMDLGFILSEELYFRGEFYDALLLLEEIVKTKGSQEYFSIFFPEVTAFMLKILKKNVGTSLSEELSLDVWERALTVGFPPKENCYFSRKIAAVYEKLGDETQKAHYETLAHEYEKQDEATAFQRRARKN